MSKSTIDIHALLAREVDYFNDVAGRDIVSRHLIEPRYTTIEWDYGYAGQRIACWIVGVLHTKQVAIAYATAGFGPSFPWGFVSLEEDSMGMDDQWYSSLEDVFITLRVLEPPPGYEVPSPRNDALSTGFTPATIIPWDQLRAELTGTTTKGSALV